MCVVSRLGRKGERASGARLKGDGGSRGAFGGGFEVEDIVLKARAWALPFGGIVLSLW